MVVTAAVRATDRLPWRDRLATSVQVTGWLHAQDFPAVRPLDIAQPVEAHGYLVTFWHYVAATGPPWEDVESLGRLLRRLHGLGDPPPELPAGPARCPRCARTPNGAPGSPTRSGPGSWAAPRS